MKELLPILQWAGCFLAAVTGNFLEALKQVRLPPPLPPALFRAAMSPPLPFCSPSPAGLAVGLLLDARGVEGEGTCPLLVLSLADWRVGEPQGCSFPPPAGGSKGQDGMPHSARDNGSSGWGFPSFHCLHSAWRTPNSLDGQGAGALRTLLSLLSLGTGNASGQSQPSVEGSACTGWKSLRTATTTSPGWTVLPLHLLLAVTTGVRQECLSASLCACQPGGAVVPGRFFLPVNPLASRIYGGGSRAREGAEASFFQSTMPQSSSQEHFWKSHHQVKVPSLPPPPCSMAPPFPPQSTAAAIPGCLEGGAERRSSRAAPAHSRFADLGSVRDSGNSGQSLLSPWSHQYFLPGQEQVLRQKGVRETWLLLPRSLAELRWNAVSGAGNWPCPPFPNHLQVK